MVMKKKTKKNIKSNDSVESFHVKILSEVENEDGSATWTIEYDERFLNLLKRHFNLKTLKKKDMEHYFIELLREAIKGYSNKLTTEDLDSIQSDI